MSRCEKLDVRFYTEKKVEVDRSLADVLDESARIVIERCENAADGIRFVEKELAFKLAGAASAQFVQTVIDHYAESKTVCADGFEEESK